MKNTRDKPCKQATSSARRRCPKWGGLNVPPRIPTFREIVLFKERLVFTIEDLILIHNDLKVELSHKSRAFANVRWRPLILEQFTELTNWLGVALQYAIGFVVLLGVLIFVHEFGHFIVAKLLGVKVLKFSLGFPPAMIKRKWGETEYMLSWVPLGG